MSTISGWTPKSGESVDITAQEVPYSQGKLWGRTDDDDAWVVEVAPNQATRVPDGGIAPFGTTVKVKIIEGLPIPCCGFNLHHYRPEERVPVHTNLPSDHVDYDIDGVIYASRAGQYIVKRKDGLWTEPLAPDELTRIPPAEVGADPWLHFREDERAKATFRVLEHNTREPDRTIRRPAAE